MAQSSCALIGPGQGPLLMLGQRARLRVRGLAAGESATITLARNGAKVAFDIPSNGEHELDVADCAQVEYGGREKGFIATLVTGD